MEVVVQLNLRSDAVGEKYLDNSKRGVYVCKNCNTKLYRSEDKFKSKQDWPAFRKSIQKLKIIPCSIFGLECQEIRCNSSNCDELIGFLYANESGDAFHSIDNERHCVYSNQLIFIGDEEEEDIEDIAKKHRFDYSQFYGNDLEPYYFIIDIDKSFHVADNNEDDERSNYPKDGHGWYFYVLCAGGGLTLLVIAYYFFSFFRYYCIGTKRIWKGFRANFLKILSYFSVT